MVRRGDADGEVLDVADDAEAIERDRERERDRRRRDDVEEIERALERERDRRLHEGDRDRCDERDRRWREVDRDESSEPMVPVGNFTFTMACACFLATKLAST